MEDVVANVVKERANSLERLGFAAAEDGQGTQACPDDASGDRGIDVDDSGVRFELKDSLHAGDRVRAEVDVDVSG